MYASEKIIPATVTFVDIAGLVAGASKGEGLGNKFLANIRETDAILHVVRAFENSDILRHDSSAIDPKNDIDIINTELILADMQTIEGRLPRLQKEAKARPQAREHYTYLESLLRHLNEGTPLSALPSLDHEIIADLHLLTAKPVIYVFNTGEDDLTDGLKTNALSKLVAPAKSLFVSAKLEEELKGLESSEQKELLESYGVAEPGLNQIIHTAYNILGLQSYLTAGPKESKAWTIHRGDTAPQAAGVIHSDFEKGFIAAQIVNYHDLIRAGSEQAARAAGKIRTEGKDYIMQPDDVVEFRFNVTK
jgi:GTP-binding protein YchF